MRIEQLEYLVAVTRYGSLRQASERLHISQPALSEAVSKLETELGVSLLDRHRSGARISREGRALIDDITGVLDAVSRLRAAAGDQQSAAHLVRLGTVTAATSQLLLPALRDLEANHPHTAVDVLDMRQVEIHDRLEEGALDLGLVNLLDGDDVPSGLLATPLLRGRAVVVLPASHRLASASEVTVDQLREEPFIAMRPGYLMHRLAQRLFGTTAPRIGRTTDGAEMGKLMVAEGLGLTLLPDFSVVGDQWERSGVLTTRPVAGTGTGAGTTVTLALLSRRGARASTQVQALVRALGDRARRYDVERANGAAEGAIGESERAGVEGESQSLVS